MAGKYWLALVSALLVGHALCHNKDNNDDAKQPFIRQVKRVLTVTPGLLYENSFVTIANPTPNTLTDIAVDLADIVKVNTFKAFLKSKDQVELDSDWRQPRQSRSVRVKVHVKPESTLEILVKVGYDARLTSPSDTIEARSRLFLSHPSHFKTDLPIHKQRSYIKYPPHTVLIVLCRVHPDMELIDLKCPEPMSRDQQSYCGTYDDQQQQQQGDGQLAVTVTPRHGALHYIDSSKTVITVHSDGQSVTVSESLSVSHLGHPLPNHSDFSRAALTKVVSKRTPDYFPFVPSIRVKLPWGARGFEVEDRLGLNWAYRRHADPQALAVYYDVQPRYPLISNWKYSFSVKFDCDLSAFKEETNDSHYSLPATFTTDRSLVKQNMVTVVLPEDANVSSDVTRQRHFLSTIGEPVLEYTDAPSVLVKIKIDIPKWARIRKPLLAIALTTLAIVAISRLFKPDPLLEQVVSLLEERKWLVMAGLDKDKLDGQIVHVLGKMEGCAGFMEEAVRALRLSVDFRTVDRPANLILSLIRQ
jgi:hypothetical protein